MQTSDKGLNVIRSFEGRALRAYQDSVGVWTIGYGNTNYDANAVAKLGKIGRGLTITPEQAESLLVESIRSQYEPAVRKRLGDLVSQAAFDAGVSFHYNTGAIARASWPAFLLKGEMGSVYSAIMAWNKAGGKELSGLTRRRNREWLMIKVGDYGPEGSSGPVEIGENGRPTGRVLPAPGSGPAQAGAPTKPPGSGMLSLHDTGPGVTEVQKWLVELGLLKSSVFGTFDAQTKAAVEAFQRSHSNLTVDGIVGPATRNALIRDAALARKAKTAGKVIATTTVSSGIAWGTLGAKVGMFLLCAAGVAVVVAGVYLAYRYRSEIAARVNRIVGREVL